MRDRIWLPHACTRTPTRVLPELHALTVLYEACQPHHPYRFEPQSAQYLGTATCGTTCRMQRESEACDRRIRIHPDPDASTSSR